jgi:hypothetical protein
VNNAESVGEFQPRVCFETLGVRMPQETLRNSEGVATVCVIAEEEQHIGEVNKVLRKPGEITQFQRSAKAAED